MDAHDDSPAMTLLRLLAQGAPAAELEAVVHDGDGTGGATPLRATLARRRRRGTRAGPAGARGVRLAASPRGRAHRPRGDRPRPGGAMRDPSGILEAIVRRARALLGTDVSYLTLFDPEAGDTFMRATDGSVSAEFQVVRLSLGDGLGGLVASTRKPYWSADYLHDHRFQHTGTIDSAVGDEGLVSICGTPLVVEDEFVGVLFAANRSPRPFSPDQVALLGSLAALAAVSIVQTRSAEEVRRHTAGSRARRCGPRPVRRAGAGRWRRGRHHQGAGRPAGRVGRAAQLRGRAAQHPRGGPPARGRHASAPRAVGGRSARPRAPDGSRTTRGTTSGRSA